MTVGRHGEGSHETRIVVDAKVTAEGREVLPPEGSTKGPEVNDDNAYEPTADDLANP